MERDPANNRSKATLGERALLGLSSNFVTDESAPAVLSLARQKLYEMEGQLSLSSAADFQGARLQGYRDTLTTSINILKGVVECMEPEFGIEVGLQALLDYANDPANGSDQA